ncbi:MAG TPA: hypothetical protein VFU45_05170 [Gemmatimonadales bacterium]|nr:hypothetical protein [Gemmatimonadales bacterium]
MKALATVIRRAPRSAAAIAFGACTATLAHFAWHADVRLDGTIPVLTLGAGLAHAMAGVLIGRRLLDTARTPSAANAALLGAGASLIAQALFVPVLAAYVAESGAAPTIIGYVGLTIYVAIFAFLAAGWAMLLLCMAVGWGLYKVAAPPAAG